MNLEYAYSLESSGLYLNPTETADGERYFYHSDHLGSSAFITTENGYATQFLAYTCAELVECVPYGETLSEQQNGTSYYSPFKFSAKEKDNETGYSYFGARFYSPELSVWLSIDPMDHKYPQYSTYHYCGLNPVMVTDPDGADWLEKEGDNGKKVVFWDASVTDASQVDPKSGQKYWGKEGFGIDEESGQAVHYKSDGTKEMSNVAAPGITITPESSYATNNPSIGPNNETGYIYNDRDLKVREGVMKTDNPIKTYLLSQEKQGRFNILNGHDYWIKHGHTNGNFHLMATYLDMALGLLQPGEMPSVKPFNLKTTGVKGTIPTQQQFFQSQKGNQTGVHKGKGAWLKAMHAEYDKRFK